MSPNRMNSFSPTGLNPPSNLWRADQGPRYSLFFPTFHRNFDESNNHRVRTLARCLLPHLHLHTHIPTWILNFFPKSLTISRCLFTLPNSSMLRRMISTRTGILSPLVNAEAHTNYLHIQYRSAVDCGTYVPIYWCYPGVTVARFALRVLLQSCLFSVRRND